MKIYGVDFTSAPHRRKAITVASGSLKGEKLIVSELERFESFPDFERMLTRPGPWIGGFDFPFGIPREAVKALKWPVTWQALVKKCERIGRSGFTIESDKLRKSRPKGRKYPKRQGDDAAKSHSPMKCVRPPVGWMFVEGAPRLLRAGVSIPNMLKGDPQRIAVEAYPGYVARVAIGRRSYKSDEPAKQDAARSAARKDLLESLQTTQNSTGIQLSASGLLFDAMLSDGTGDLLDAAICAMQAGWALQRKYNGYGLPPSMDPLEGWIATVPAT
jgi:hypothetical protein